MNLDEIRRRYDRAQQLLARKGDHPAARTRGAVVSADDVPALLAEVEELATELAEERTLHQQAIAERDEARAEADRLGEELAWMQEMTS